MIKLKGEYSMVELLYRTIRTHDPTGCSDWIYGAYLLAMAGVKGGSIGGAVASLGARPGALLWRQQQR